MKSQKSKVKSQKGKSKKQPSAIGNFTHFGEHGRAKMVDVSEKAVTAREAIAKGLVKMRPETLQMIETGGIKKGDVLAVAQVAGIMAAKKTHELIPMCHPLQITGVDIDFTIRKPDSVEIKATVKTTGRTGVEMEALVSVAAAALTIYDMCKAIDRGMVIDDIKLMKKSGGKSGIFVRKDD
jgi:cyclic pyranopterin phosphate synthase